MRRPLQFQVKAAVYVVCDGYNLSVLMSEPMAATGDFQASLCFYVAAGYSYDQEGSR